jgi:hypothetical protein
MVRGISPQYATNFNPQIKREERVTQVMRSSLISSHLNKEVMSVD